MPATKTPQKTTDQTPGLDVYNTYVGGVLNSTRVSPINGCRTWEQRIYTSYLGPKVKPLKKHPHAYYLNKQRVELKTEYDYKNYSGPYLVNHQYGAGPGLHTNFSGLGASEPLYNWSALENQALSKLNANMRGSLDLSIAAGQARQTAGLLKPVSRLLHYSEKFASSVSRRDWRGLTSGISEARLEYQYGIKPLAQDIYDVLNKDPLMTQDGIIEVRGSARDEGFHPNKILVNSIYGNVNFSLRDTNFVVATKYSVNVRAGNQTFERWTSMNPASILWELMPYSFVVDWVYDIGGYLRSLETAFLSRSIFVSGYQTRYVKGGGSIYWPVVNQNFWHGGFETIDVTRTLLAQYPFPNAPSLQVNMGSGRMFNAAALLGVMLGRKEVPRFQGRQVRTINEREYRKPRYFNSKSWKEKFTEWSRD